MRRTLFLIGLAASVASTAPAQSTQFRQVFASDSIVPAFAMTSPDGKWIVMARREGTLGGSLWIASVAGGPPTRLTSSGYNDAQPAWFASGDRVVFMSTRPNRNGGRQQFLMTLGIDPATGRAIGAPRQVSSEPVVTRARPSADGRWLVYLTVGEPALVKIVPATGGNARTLLQGTHPVSGLQVSDDGRHVYYTQQAGANGERCQPANCRSFTIKRLAVDGGATVDVATASHPIRLLAADPRYVQHQVSGVGGGAITWELRDSTGKALGRIEFPEGVSQNAITGDGYGLVGIKRQSERSIRLATVAGGPTRIVTSGDRRWTEAWTADGSGLLTDRSENGRVVVEETSLSGGHGKQFTLPAGAHSSGWQSSVGPWFSYQLNPGGLYALNVVTSETKMVAKGVVTSWLARGGNEQDGNLWFYSERVGDHVEFRSTDPATGATTLIRSFPALANKQHFRASGSQLAWLEARGDSVDYMMTDDATSPPRRIFSARGRLDTHDESMAWSWKGDRLALCASTGPQRTVTILTIPASRSAPVTKQEYPVAPATSCWAPQWLPGDSALLLLVVTPQSPNVPDLARLQLTAGASISLLTTDDPNEIWSYLVSPDGRYAAYTVDLPASRSSIHVASFKDLIQPRR